MAIFLSVPLKRASELDIAKPLSSFISSTYSSEDRPTDHEAVNELQKLRNKAVCNPLDKHESSLEILYRYHDQLVAIETKLPITPTNIPIPFKWKDAFDKGSIFWGKASLTVSSGLYEKACVLFNIGALQSQIAASQKLDTDEEMKTAAKMFQMSAGTFNHLKEVVMSLVQQEPTLDLMPDTLSALSVLMLAQGQEAIYLKAAKDQMKPGIVAKIAAQCAEFYADASRQMSKEMLKALWEKEWMMIVNGKQLAFQGLSHYQQSLLSKENKEIGEELSRLQEATKLMQKAQGQFPPAVSILKTEAATVAKAHELAKKDNDFIYHERIPDIKSLSVIAKAAVAKALAPASPMSPKFKDLFESLVPVAVHQALAAYDLRRTEIINGEVGRMREQTQLMNGILASLNLPAAIEDVVNHDALPDSLRDKSSRVRNAGGSASLEKMINELPTLLKRNREILDETASVLNEEKTTDDQLKAQFKDRWTRMPSEKLTEPLWQEVGKYRQILDTAMHADGVVKQKFDANRQGFNILSKPEEELKSCIPGLGAASKNSNSPAVAQLKGLMAQVDELKKEREQLESELKDTTFDMTSIFLGALASDGSVQEEAISTEKLNDIYGPLRQKITAGAQRQESVMAQVQQANTQFCQEKSGDTTGAERENMLKMLAASHDAFMELRSNLQEGTKFYNDLTPLLVRLQQKVSDFCFARKTEKDDLLKDLQTTAGSNPPPRPPPPTQTATAPTQQPQQTYGQQQPVAPPRASKGEAQNPAAPQGAAAYQQQQPQQPPYPQQAYQQYGTYPGASGAQPMQNPYQQPYQQNPYQPQQQQWPQQGNVAPYPMASPYPAYGVPQAAAPQGYNPNPYAQPQQQTMQYGQQMYGQPQPHYGQQPTAQSPYPQQYNPFSGQPQQ